MVSQSAAPLFFWRQKILISIQKNTHSGVLSVCVEVLSQRVNLECVCMRACVFRRFAFLLWQKCGLQQQPDDGKWLCASFRKMVAGCCVGHVGRVLPPWQITQWVHPWYQLLLDLWPWGSRPHPPTSYYRVQCRRTLRTTTPKPRISKATIYLMLLLRLFANPTCKMVSFFLLCLWQTITDITH
jgi:hypothetical protein